MADGIRPWERLGKAGLAQGRSCRPCSNTVRAVLAREHGRKGERLGCFFGGSQQGLVVGMWNRKPHSIFASQVAGQTCLVPMFQSLEELEVEIAILIFMTKKRLGPMVDRIPGLTTGTLRAGRAGAGCGWRVCLSSQCPGSQLVTYPVKADERTWPSSYISQT